MLLVEKEESWQAMRRGIEDAVAFGILPRERLEQSLERIRAAKKGWSPPKGPFSKKLGSGWHGGLKSSVPAIEDIRKRKSTTEA